MYPLCSDCRPKKRKKKPCTLAFTLFPSPSHVNKIHSFGPLDVRGGENESESKNMEIISFKASYLHCCRHL